MNNYSTAKLTQEENTFSVPPKNMKDIFVGVGSTEGGETTAIVLQPYDIGIPAYLELILSHDSNTIQKYLKYIPYNPALTDATLACAYLRLRSVADEITYKTAFEHYASTRPAETPFFWKKIPFRMRLEIYSKVGYRFNQTRLFDDKALKSLLHETMRLRYDKYGLFAFTKQFMLSDIRWKPEYQILMHNCVSSIKSSQSSYIYYGGETPCETSQLMILQLNYFMTQFSTADQIRIWQRTPTKTLEIYRALDWSKISPMRPCHSVMDDSLIKILLNYGKLYDYTTPFTNYVIDSGNITLFTQSCQIPEFIISLYKILDHNYIRDVILTNGIRIKLTVDVRNHIPPDHYTIFQNSLVLTPVSSLGSHAECPVCLESLGELYCKTPCGHIFHYDCLIKWFEWSRTCPFCRCSIHS